jgi:hypothetical protein
MFDVNGFCIPFGAEMEKLFLLLNNKKLPFNFHYLLLARININTMPNY